MDTIYALASGQGKAGVAVIRISGPAAHDTLARLAGRVPPLRVMSLAALRDRNGQMLDQALVVAFPEGKSFTGEQTVELHLHGSPAVVSAVMTELSQLAMCRLAEPGEFTRRALSNGQLDLTEVEGLADLIQAETEAQRKQALAVLSGALGDKVAAWRRDLVHAMALNAVTIDFSDEEVPDEFDHQILKLLNTVEQGISSELDGIPAAERVRDGFKVAILGRPNAGKSTLLNTLAGREAALTSDIAGTTRDVIEVRMDIDGLPVTLLDTAGIRDSENQIEKMGVARALDYARDADLRVVLVDDDGLPSEISLSSEDIILRAKSDLDPEGTGISGKTGAGVNQLLARISDVLGKRSAQAGSASHFRHKVAMEQAKAALESARFEVQQGSDRSEFVSEYLRQVVQAMDELVGLVDVEDVLDDIFCNFCLGK